MKQKQVALILISIALLVISVSSGAAYISLSSQYSGTVCVRPVDEGEVGDREVFDFEKNRTVRMVAEISLAMEGDPEGSSLGISRENMDGIEQLRQLPMYEPPGPDPGTVFKEVGIFYVRYEGEVYRVEFSIDRCIDDPFCETNMLIYISLASFLGFVTIALYLLCTRVCRKPGESR